MSTFGTDQLETLTFFFPPYRLGYTLRRWLRSNSHVAHVKAGFFPLTLPLNSGTWVWYPVYNEHQS
jgi:hypothetical protein